MEIGPALVTPVGQIRVCIETVEALSKENDTKNIAHHYNGCREKINEFISTYTSSAPLNTLLHDIKNTYKMENLDTLNDLILRLSFEEGLHAVIVFLKDANETVKTVGLVQKGLDQPYTLIDSKLGFAFECKNLDVDVLKTLQQEKAPFGYLLCIKQPKIEEPEEKKPKIEQPEESHEEKKEPKKRRKLVIPKRKNIIGEATSEESTNK